MLLIRSLLFFLALVLTTSLFAVLVTLSYPLPVERRKVLAELWARSCLWSLKVLCDLGFRVSGEENLRGHGGRIVLCNHQSAWETIALQRIIPGPQAWVLKRELLWIPLFGWALAATRAIAIDRSAGRPAVERIIARGKARLDEGCSVMIFPEGTRVAPGATRRWGKGGGLLAADSGYPVVPVAHNAGVFWARRGLLKHPGTIDVEIGPPIDTRGLSAEEINAKAKSWVTDKLQEFPQSRGV